MSSEIDADLLGKLAGQVVNVFRSWVARCEDLPVAVAAILALTEVVKQSQASTIMGLEVELKAASDILKETVRLCIVCLWRYSSDQAFLFLFY